MPVRLEPFIVGHIYHIFNKTLDNRQLFKNPKSCRVFLNILKYYRSTKAKISFSKLKFLDKRRLREIEREVSYQRFFKANILAYCVMPTHFHLLLKESVDGGIQKLMADVINSLTKHCNPQLERKGPIFLPKFKSEGVSSDEQLLHVSRYIHLNPYSAGVVRTLSELETYPWSSLMDYIFDNEETMVDTSTILAFFGGGKDKYKDFILSNADYQKTLEYIKHMEKW